MDEPLDRVLVVEDDEQLRMALARSLRRLGYDVEVAANGVDGLRLALASPPSVLLTDLRMPEMDGHTLLRRLAGHDLDTAIVAMSSHGDVDDLVEVLRHGAVDYLKKPWTATELASALARATEIQHKRRDQRAAVAARAGAPVDAAAPLGSPAVAGDHGPGERGRQVDPVFAAVLDRLRRGDIVLPAIAPVVGELRVLIRDARATIDDVAAIVERDPRLAAQVLRLANSAQYSRGGRSNDARAAVRRIGMAQIKGIADTLHAHDFFQVREPALRALHARVWKYSLARALAMRALVDLAPARLGLDGDTAYGAGLLCDTGATFLIWLAAERGASAPDPVDACVAAVREQHAEVGALLLARWDLDPVICAAAGHHHAGAPPAPPDPYWEVSVLAAQLADALVPEGDLTRTEPVQPALLERCSAALGIGSALLGRMKPRLAAELAEILEVLA
jgi:CheY-like chemotaxis protein/HD-like signal output (HDOD) protein